MSHPLARRFLVLLLIVCPLAGGAQSRAQTTGSGNAPEVLKVEPPSWWLDHSINPVRLLVRGRNLSGAHVEADGTGLTTSGVGVNGRGTYLFVDVTIRHNARPGRYALRIVSPSGVARFSFDVLTPLPPLGRFQGFSPDDFIYELMPDRFSDGDLSNDNPPQSPGLFDRSKPRFYHGGDLQGVINHLPYLKDLGATALWLTPIYDNADRVNDARYGNQASTDYHGYGAIDFYGVEEHFGDLKKLRELVDDAHHVGIKVIQDEVANHTGPFHPWVEDPPTPTWYHGTVAHHLNETWQTWTLIDPHAPPLLKEPVLDGWFAGVLPDLNQDDSEVERYLIQNTLWWIGVAGFDGIREDTLPYVPRRFWRDWMAAIKRQYPRVDVVGEVYDGDPAMTSFFQGGQRRFDAIDSGVDTVFDFPLLYPLRSAFAEGQTLRPVAAMLGHDEMYPRPDLLVTFVGNHDMPRFANSPGASPDGLELALTFIMTTRGIPMIYSGDEIAMPGGADPDNRRDFPGGWPGDPRNAFEASGRTQDEEAVFERLRKLAHLRQELEPLRRGKLVDLAIEDQAYAYARVTTRSAVIVIMNNGKTDATLNFSVRPARLADGATLVDRLAGGPPLSVHNGRITVTLHARSAAMYTEKVGH